ncbi:MAG: hypothetical protein ACOYXB_03095 [Bacteroidota bacterium]
MANTFTWKRGLFSNTCGIYSNGELVGSIHEKSFSKWSEGTFKGRSFLFRTTGFLKQQTEIIEKEDMRVIGQIVYGNWMNRATISLEGRTFMWKYENAWNTKWLILDDQGPLVSYAGTMSKGRIEARTDEALLIVTGMAITNYFWQLSVAAFVAIFVPIWVSVLH